MQFKYKSPAGQFTIRPLLSARWALSRDETLIGTYPSPQSAVDDVYFHMTGLPDWDSLVLDNVPATLSDWDMDP